jgi:DNA modification methylase
MLDFGYYNMDCMEGMKQFPDKYFELAIVDPPYGIGMGGVKSETQKQIIKITQAATNQYPIVHIIKNFLGLVKTKLYGVVII